MAVMPRLRSAGGGLISLHDLDRTFLRQWLKGFSSLLGRNRVSSQSCVNVWQRSLFFPSLSCFLTGFAHQHSAGDSAETLCRWQKLSWHSSVCPLVLCTAWSTCLGPSSSHCCSSLRAWWASGVPLPLSGPGNPLGSEWGPLSPSIICFSSLRDHSLPHGCPLCKMCVLSVFFWLFPVKE
jgi:hypothetical protein